LETGTIHHSPFTNSPPSRQITHPSILRALYFPCQINQRICSVPEYRARRRICLVCKSPEEPRDKDSYSGKPAQRSQA
jgi:hypothetical protein